jgi:hypothetical protein
VKVLEKARDYEDPNALHMELLGENTGAQTEGRLGGLVLSLDFWGQGARDDGGKDGFLSMLGRSRESGGNRILTL